MKHIQNWLKENKYDFIKHKDKEFSYIILPFCVFVKINKINYISFDIQEDKSFCFEFYSKIQCDLADKTKIGVYYDCYYDFNDMLEIENLSFGDQARNDYFVYVNNLMQHDLTIPKDVLYS